jgi:hypothetical protein
MHCMAWYISRCGITAMGLLYRLYNMVKYVCYMGLESNGCFMAGTVLMDGHYKTDIISCVSHPRSNSVVLLVLVTQIFN